MNQAEINQSWSRSSENYDSIVHDELRSFRVEAWQTQILSHFPAGKHLRILDIGCGPAFFSIILSAKGHRVTGIDGADGMLQRARANVAAARSDAEILEMDANHLDFPDGTFDLLVSRNVTHTLLDHAAAYTEWRRVLKPDGLLLIYDANWHLPGADPELRECYRADWRSCIQKYGSDFNGNTDPDGPAPFEREFHEPHRLGDLRRPDYDVGVLQAVGFREIQIRRNIIEHLWDDKEKLIYGSTPMFEIAARK
jgi:SAM-dependent methyltransferase